MPTQKPDSFGAMGATRWMGKVAAAVPAPLLVRTIAVAHRRFEPELAHLDAILPTSRRTALDIGAWYGPWAMALASRFERVTTIEPNPDVAARLRRALPANVTLETFAASDEAGTATLHTPAGIGAEGVGSLHADGPGMRDVEVETRPVDDLGLTDVDFLKVDVEGHEIEALRGATATITASWPVIVVELEPRLAPVGPVFEHLLGLGYSANLLDGDHLEPLDPAAFVGTAAAPRSYVSVVLHPDRTSRQNNVIFLPG